jgi:preprotein translocase subunit SecA
MQSQGEILKMNEDKFLSEFAQFKKHAVDKAGQTFAHYVVAMGFSVKVLEMLVKSDPLILDKGDFQGNLPIHTAASEGNVEALEYLIKLKKEHLEARNQNDITPLYAAIQYGRETAVTILLKYGAQVNHRLPNGLFPLYIAIQNGFDNIAIKLLQSNNLNMQFILDSGESALHLAIDYGRVELANEMIKKGCPVNLKRKTDGYTALHCAAAVGKIEVIQAIMSTQAIGVDSALESGKTPLHLAVEKGKLLVVKTLVEDYKAKVDTCTTEQETPLMIAVQNGQLDIARYLASIAAINKYNKFGQSVSLLAAINNQFEISDILIERGENPLVLDKFANCYLSQVIKFGEYHRYLALAKSTKDLVLPKGSPTPVELSIQHGMTLLTDYLLEQNSKEITINGWNVIHFATKADELGYLKKYLLKNSLETATIQSGLDKGKTLAYIAAENRSEHCLDFILKSSNEKLIKNAFNQKHLLCAAINSGSQRILEQVLKFVNDINIPLDERGNTMAHLVVQRGFIKLVHYLKKIKVSFTIPNKDKLSPLHYAIKNQDNEMFTLLLEKIVDKDRWPDDLMAYAIKNYNQKAQNILKSRDINNKDISQNYQALLTLSQLGNVSEVTKLLASGLDPNTIVDKKLCLHEAISNKHEAVVKVLLMYKADPKKEQDGLDAFQVALKNNCISIMKLLHKHHEPNKIKKVYLELAKTSYAKEAVENNFIKFDIAASELMDAIDNFNLPACVKILKQGFPFDELLVSNHGRIREPVLHVAFSYGFKDLIEYLAKNQVDPLVLDSNGYGLSYYLNGSAEKFTKLMRYIQKYFSKQINEILSQKMPNGHTLLSQAAENADFALIKLMSNDENTILGNINNELGDSWLHLLTQSNNIELVKNAITPNNINAFNAKYETPLMCAINQGNLQLVTCLLERGANPNFVNILQNNALHVALIQKHLSIINLLIPYITDINRKNRDGNTALMLAARQGMISIVQRLAKSGTNLHARNKKGAQALHLAAAGGHTKIVEILLDLGADINTVESLKPDKSDNYTHLTPLHYAATRGHTECFILLLKRGASLWIQDVVKNTALECSFLFNKYEMITVIRQLPEFHDIQNQSALLNAAARFNQVSLVRELIQAGLSVNTTNEFGQTPLFFAAANGALQTTIVLIEQGVDLEAKELDGGNTALHYAISSVSIIQELYKNGANLNCKNDKLETPLFRACAGGKLSAVAMLLLLGADFQIKNKAGFSPAEVALENGFFSIVELFMTIGENGFELKKLQTLPKHMLEKLNKSSETLQKWQRVIKTNITNPLGIAILLKNEDALKVACTLFPNALSEVIQNNVSPLQFAKSESFLDGERIITSFQTKPPKNFQKGTLESKRNIEKALPLVKSFFSEHPSFIILSKYVSNQALAMLSLSLELMQENQRCVLLEAWVDFFQKILQDKTLQEKFMNTFLKIYPWHIIYSENFLLLFKRLIESNHKKLLDWFWAYFRPIALSPLSNKSFISAVSVFERFFDICVQKKLGDTISSPPRFSISFLLDGSQYLESCIFALTRFKASHELSNYLDNLPALSIIKEAYDNGLNLVSGSLLDSGKLIIVKDKSEYKNLKDLTLLRIKTLSYLAYSNYCNYSVVDCFYQKLNKVKSKDLNHDDKLLLIYRFLDCIDPKVPTISKKITAFIDMSIEIKKQLGIRIFRKLYSTEQSFHQDNLDNYIAVTQALIVLCDEPDLEQLFIRPFNLKDFVNVLEDKKRLFFRKQYPEKNLEDRLQAFNSQQNKLGKDEITHLGGSYLEIMKISEKLSKLSAFELTEQALQEMKTLKENKQINLKMIAIIREVVRLTFKIYPYNTQILSVLAILRKPESMKGRIAQIKTGEGKSLIVAMLAAYIASTGKFVDIVTSSDKLSIRDYDKFNSFFKQLGITSSHICFEKPKQGMFDGQIVFGTNYHFMFSILRDNLYGSKHRTSIRDGKSITRECEAVIVDEVDNLVIDTASNPAIMSVTSYENTSWLYEPIFHYVSICKKDECSPQSLRKFLLTSKSKSHQKQIASFTDQMLSVWINSAYIALGKKEENDYVITLNKEKQQSIKIVDFEVTGRVKQGSRWQDGIHEFVEVKHHIVPKNQSYTGAFISHPTFFSQYQEMYGLTGTMGSIQERMEIQELYKLESFDVPPHLPSQRKQLPIVFCSNENQYECILKDIQGLARKRPVLVLLKTIRASKDFSEYLHKQSIEHRVLNDIQEEDEDFILSKAGKASAISIATNTAGRGTDIILSSDAKDAGGLHVIFGFYTLSVRVEEQGMGRAGRQGQPGSCRMIVSLADPDIIKCLETSAVSFLPTNFVASELNKAREKYMKLQSVARVLSVREDLITYDMQSVFLKSLQKIREGVANIPMHEKISICNEVVLKPVNISDSILQNVLMKMILPTARSLILQKESGLTVNWDPFIERFTYVYIENLLQEWGKLFTEIHKNKMNHDFNKMQFEKFYAENISNYLPNVKEKYFQCIVFVIRASTQLPENWELENDAVESVFEYPSEIPLRNPENTSSKQKSYSEVNPLLSLFDAHKDFKQKKNSGNKLNDNTKKLIYNAGNNPYTIKTRGEGDCAFHAVLGRYNEVCYSDEDIFRHRKMLGDAVKKCHPGSEIFPYVLEAIRSIIFENERIGDNAFECLYNNYKEHCCVLNSSVKNAWDSFELELLNNKLILEYIHSKTKNNPKLKTLNSKFFDSLNHENGQLYKLINESQNLRKLFLDYNEITSKSFNFEFEIFNNNKRILNAYADYLSKPNNWLLPVELGIVAIVFNIKIHLYTFNPYIYVKSGPQTYNPNARTFVEVCFDGHGHFERMLPSVDAEKPNLKMDKHPTKIGLKSSEENSVVTPHAYGVPKYQLSLSDLFQSGNSFHILKPKKLHERLQLISDT